MGGVGWKRRRAGFALPDAWELRAIARACHRFFDAVASAQRPRALGVADLSRRFGGQCESSLAGAKK